MAGAALASQSDGTVISNINVDDTVEAVIDDSDAQSEITTIRSSVFDYRYENGRRYHAYHAGAYWGPNDEKAAAGMDLSHHVFTLVLGGKLYLAPISDDIKNVLDVGTGTGIWAVDFADAFPQANVLGTDLSPIQPSWAPPNVNFEVNDCCDPWTFHTKFDYIHIRAMYGSVADWTAFYAEVFKNLQPGGWVEHMEVGVVPKSFDHTTDGTIFERWGKVSLDAGEAFGKTLRIADMTGDLLRGAGFENVVEHRLAMPLGSWPKDKQLKMVGFLNRAQWEENLEGWTWMLLTQYLKWTPEAVKDYQDEMRRGLRTSSVHAYQDVTISFARKPMA